MQSLYFLSLPMSSLIPSLMKKINSGEGQKNHHNTESFIQRDKDKEESRDTKEVEIGRKRGEKKQKQKGFKGKKKAGRRKG